MYKVLKIFLPFSLSQEALEDEFYQNSGSKPKEQKINESANKNPPSEAVKEMARVIIKQNLRMMTIHQDRLATNLSKLEQVRCDFLQKKTW